MLWDNFAYPVMELDPLVNVIHYPRSLWELRAYANAFDILVWGGGAIIDDSQYSNDPLKISTGNLFIHLSKLIEARDKQVVCLGLSTSAALANPQLSKAIANIAEHCEVLAIRDHHSMESLVACGVPQESLSTCSDLVFANSILQRMRDDRKGTKRGHELPNQPFTIAFVALCTDYVQQHYIRVLSHIQKELNHDRNREAHDVNSKGEYRIVLVPFGNLEAEDTRYYQQLLNKMEVSGNSIDNIEVAAYTNQVSNLALCQCDFYIAYKYHAALIANAVGLPSISVCATRHPHYPNKMAHLAHICDYSNNLIDDYLFEQQAGTLLIKKIADGCGPHVSESLFEETDSWLQTTIEQMLAH